MIGSNSQLCVNFAQSKSRMCNFFTCFTLLLTVCLLPTRRRKRRNPQNDIFRKHQPSSFEFTLHLCGVAAPSAGGLWNIHAAPKKDISDLLIFYLFPNNLLLEKHFAESYYIVMKGYMRPNSPPQEPRGCKHVVIVLISRLQR